jgi:crotonobetainyl-CoA:carnitine CoA-transferase CaiB-like acyl-CoA transferase
MQPLEGIRVLDFTHALAGAACTNSLGRFGARVTKVERPGVGDDLRHYTEHAGMPQMALPFCSANAGKRSVTLNLEHPQAAGIVARMVRDADIVVENFRPGVAGKLGIDWPALSRINPRLIYCSVSGFGQSGPLRDWTAYDHIVQAMSGIMWVNGEPERGPLKVGMPAVDTFTGFLAALAVLAALRRAEATGQGEFIDVAMIDAALLLMSSTVATFLYSGQLPKRLGNQGYRLVPTAGMFPTADGFIAIGANHQHQVERLFQVLGISGLLNDQRFSTHGSRQAHGAELHELLRGLIASQQTATLETLLAEARVPASKVRSIDESTSHPQVAERHLIVEAAVPGRPQPIRILRGAPRLAGAADAVGAVPQLGEHTAEVMRELGLSATEIEVAFGGGLLWRPPARPDQGEGNDS